MEIKMENEPSSGSGPQPGSQQDSQPANVPSLTDLATLINDLDQDRAWLLEQIDRGRWPELRLDLAALERELGQLLVRAGERLEGDGRRI
jgi:hypothetical protein